MLVKFPTPVDRTRPIYTRAIVSKRRVLDAKVRECKLRREREHKLKIELDLVEDERPTKFDRKQEHRRNRRDIRQELSEYLDI